MTASGPPPGRGGALVGRLGMASAVLACVALPALVAGLSLGADPAPGELARLEAATSATTGSRLADAFVAATAWAFGGEAAASASHLDLVRARLSQLAAWFALASSLYAAGFLARGRLLGIAACLALACLPPVHACGQVLRGETWASAFTLLGLVLLQCLVRRSRGRPRATLPLAATTAAAIGLAVATAPTLGTALLVPSVPFLLVALQALLRGLRIGVVRSWLAVPARAITGRLWGPGLAAILSPVAALVLLVVAVDGQGPPSTALAVGLLPVATLPRALLAIAAVVGAAAFLLGAGVRFGRGGRLGAELVLAIYCGTQLLHAQFGRDRDPTPGAPAVAMLAAHGLLSAVAAAAWLVQRPARRSRAG